MEKWSTLDEHHRFLHSKAFGPVAKLLGAIFTIPFQQQYHFNDIPNASNIFSAPHVEFAFFRVKMGKVFEFYRSKETLFPSGETSCLGSVDGAIIYKLEEPFMHGRIVGLKIQEVLS
jgi:hypothetical protein